MKRKTKSSPQSFRLSQPLCRAIGLAAARCRTTKTEIVERVLARWMQERSRRPLA